MAASKLEQKLLGWFSVIIIALTVGMCFLVTYFPNLHNVASGLKDTWYLTSSTSGTSVLELMRVNPNMNSTTETVDYLKGHQLRFELPVEYDSSNIEISSSPMEYVVNMTIPGIKSSYVYDYPMIGVTDGIIDITFDSYGEVGYFTFQLDDVKEVRTTYDDRFMYMDFVDPKDVFDYVVVFDAGHGADSVGAVKNDVYEKDINLEMLLCVKEIFDKEPNGIHAYYTKTTDVNPSYASRVNLPNYADADLYVSIHNNSTSTGRTSDVKGTEVIYKGSDQSGESRRFAEIMLTKVTNKLGSVNNGTVVGDDLYIVRRAQMPVAMIEVGFMTNPGELINLCDHDYQMKLAEAIYEGILEYLEIEK